MRRIKSMKVEEDDGLESEEKQFSIVGTKRENKLRVHSEIRGITRRLIDHNEFEEENRRVKDDSVVAVTGLIPWGCVKIRKSEREYGSFAHVISDSIGDDNE